MEYNMIIEVIKLVCYLILGGLAIWFKASSKAQAKAKEVQEVIADITAKAVLFIKEAEVKYQDTTNMGGIKFNEVVDRLYNLVPQGLNVIITREMIADIVQSTFDQIEEYVKLQLEKAVNSNEK